MERNIQNLLGNIGNGIKSKVSSIFVPAKQVVSPAAPPIPTIKGVPPEYVPYIQEASKHTGIPVEQLASQFNSENGGNWSPTLRGKKDKTDLGITQLNPIAVATITGKNGGTNYFKNNYGEEFDPTNPRHQILGSGVYMNYLRQAALPAAGIKNPTTTDVMTSYNTGAAGYAKAKAGNSTKQARMRTYQNLLTSHGAQLTQ
jgi:hypothetical protein